MPQKQDIKPPVPCRPCSFYKLQLDYYKLIYIKEEKHPYTYTDYKLLVFTLRNSNLFFFFQITFILFQGIHLFITSMIHCTDSYKLMSITFWNIVDSLLFPWKQEESEHGVLRMGSVITKPLHNSISVSTGYIITKKLMVQTSPALVFMLNAINTWIIQVFIAFNMKVSY